MNVSSFSMRIQKMRPDKTPLSWERLHCIFKASFSNFAVEANENSFICFKMIDGGYF